MSRHRHFLSKAIAISEVLAVAALILFLTRLAFLEPTHFSGDFGNHSLYIQHQADALRTLHAPSLYLNTDFGAFYPIFAFYGGTLYVIGAAVSLLTGGSSYTAEALVYALAFAMAYGGWYWLARMVGARGWVAHAPAIVYVTAPCVLTQLYVAQAFPQAVATAAIPLMIASALSVGRADRLRAGPTAALALSTIAFTGSHNITLLWGTIVLALSAAVIVMTVPAARTLISRRGATRILAVVAPAIAVNAWFLLPDLAYAHDTAITQRLWHARNALRAPNEALTLSHQLFPRRADFAIYTLPVFALAWALLAAATVRLGRGTPWRRLLVVLTLQALSIAVLMSQIRVLASLPSPFILLQFGHRLATFALCGFCGALVSALALVNRPRSWLAGLLALVLAACLAQAADQVHRVKLNSTFPDLSLNQTVSYGLGDYADGTAPVVLPSRSQGLLILQHEDVHGGRATFPVKGSAGTVFLINVMAPVSLVHVSGANVIGRWVAPPAASGWQQRWYLALQIPPDATGQRHTITISGARTFPIVAGRIISILGLLGLAAIAALLTWRRLGPLRPRGLQPRPPRAAAP